MRDVDRRHAEPLVQVANLDLHLLAQLLVERRQGLVHEQDARLEDDGAGERDALALTARELVDVAGAELAELDQLEHLLHALGDLRLGDPAEPQRDSATLPATVMCGNRA